VKKIADDKKITMVLTTAPLLYYHEALDLTDDVLRALGVDPAAVVPDDAAEKTAPPVKPASAPR
jgi:hypothetical protein